MGVYVYFTDEQKQRANNVDLVNFLEMQGEKLLKSGREKRLASDRSITIRGNKWYDHSLGSEEGGFAIDFVQNFYGLSFPEAVTMLLGCEQGEVYRPAEKKKQKPQKPFALPPAHSDMRRTYAYLVKTRLIDREVVSFFAREKLLYESCEKSQDGTKEYHNAVFVGIDENGVAKHAHKRGIYTGGNSFKGNVDSCDPAYSFHYIGTSNRLYVFEAPIDMLSYITLHPKGWQEHSYVCLCGVSEHAMLKMLELHSHLNHVLLALDNDPAGIEASEKYYDMLTEKEIQCGRACSKYKDWNEDIKAAHGLPALPAEPHPQHLLRDEICKELTSAPADQHSKGSADLFSSMVQKIRSHVHWGRFTEAEETLQEMLCNSVSNAAREYRQMNHSRDLSTVHSRLRYGFKAYENRGQFKTRMDLLEKEIMALRGYDRVLSAEDKVKLAECYEEVASHCLKGVILLELKQQKQEQRQNAVLTMT